MISPDPDFAVGQESASLRFTQAPCRNCRELVDEDELFGSGGGSMCPVVAGPRFFGLIGKAWWRLRGGFRPRGRVGR